MGANGWRGSMIDDFKCQDNELHLIENLINELSEADTHLIANPYCRPKLVIKLTSHLIFIYMEWDDVMVIP
ncbi:CLUMA_CG004059, isoform A [Clunio marinus]|uniref:CLUMA_CG004059, isoform A n=1 Tax=Clunio marinus TaxID=568069 RepID=A0A1J1HUV5_9DIPT|nr:CLUMA_CG004059, isoform A [Clunio marinus]